MATKKRATKVAKKAPAKKAAKKGANRAYKVRVKNPNFEKEKKYEAEGNCDMEARALTPEEVAYEIGKRHALSENVMVSTTNQISGVKNNLKFAEEEQRKDELNVAFLNSRIAERAVSINHMRVKLDELETRLEKAIKEAIL